MSIVDIIKEHNAKRPFIRARVDEVLHNCDSRAEFIVRVLVTGEIADATAAAVEERKRVIGSVPEQQRGMLIDDPTVLEDAKTVEMVWRACRDIDDPNKPAFPSAQWLRAHLTAEEMNALASLYLRAERVASRVPAPLTVPERVSLAVVVAANADDQHIDNLLMAFPKTSLVDWAVWLAKDWAKRGGADAAVVDASKTS